MLKTVYIKASKKGFLTIPLEFDATAAQTGAILTIPMIPERHSLVNHYHILVYIPNKENFNYNFLVKCPDGSLLSQNQKQHKQFKAKLEVSRLSKVTQLLNF